MDNLAASLGISKEVQATLDVGSNHDRKCRCKTCHKWWRLMGPQNAEDADQPGYVPNYGPFRPNEFKVINNHYFKDFGDHRSYMSGLPIPVDPDGVCRGIDFVSCQFHAGCSVPYEDCTFTDCDGTPNYKQE